MPEGAQQAHCQDPGPGRAPLCPDAPYGRQVHTHHWPGSRHGDHDHDGSVLQHQAPGEVPRRWSECVLQEQAIKDRGAPARGECVRNEAQKAPKRDGIAHKTGNPEDFKPLETVAG